MDDADPNSAALPPDDEYAARPDQVARWRRHALQFTNWRPESAKCEEYYDSNQYDAATLREYRKRGIPPLYVNLIYLQINGVVGTAEKSKLDFVVRVEDNADADLGAALSAELKRIERQSGADRATLGAFKREVLGGIGWVEVAPESDPFKADCRTREVNWREMSWDPRAREADLSDAEWVRRERWFPRETLAKAFPHMRDTLAVAGTGSDMRYRNDASPYLFHSEAARDQMQTQTAWMNTENALLLEEYWYRVKVEGLIVRMDDGRVVEFDRNDPRHQAAWQAGLIEPEAAVFERLRQAFYVGPHRLLDRWSPLPHNDIPYVAFIAHVEAATGAPYGLGRVMLPLQDEVNTRRAKMMASLQSTRVLADRDAVTDHAAAAEEVNAKDAYIILNPDRKNADGFKLQDHAALNSQQFNVYSDAKLMLQEVSGVRAPMLGGQVPGVESGVAMQSLIDQSMTTLGEVTNHYLEARQRVGRQLMALIAAKLRGRRNVSIAFDEPGGRKGAVTFNAPTQHPDGYEYLSNDVSLLNLKVSLDDVPSTPTYRAQVFQEMLRTVAALPQDVQSMMVPSLVEASELPGRVALAEMMRKKLGLTPPATPEEQQAAAQAAQQEAVLKELQVRQLAAKADFDAAKAEKARAEGRRADQQVAEIAQDMAAQEEALAGQKPEVQILANW